ncbi:MAG: hypothetical protein ACPGVG_10365, partial [Mycobacterium sp.]
PKTLYNFSARSVFPLVMWASSLTNRWLIGLTALGTTIVPSIPVAAVRAWSAWNWPSKPG